MNVEALKATSKEIESELNFLWLYGKGIIKNSRCNRGLLYRLNVNNITDDDLRDINRYSESASKQSERMQNTICRILELCETFRDELFGRDSREITQEEKESTLNIKF